ncbi:hypothetical protein G6F57_005979 [Rhizopus arrhizus]|uniref:Uncharacterized protein n=1 Tax=Rhizopus oryzae TaxID=64495 RepID=A0A9P6X9S3_RHIOR|nr:hypothetical protein G6F21_006292 [Rhizopus arrhizus]KAG0811447.1 hypothetical protein G6F20_007150 [Rhizopus arrhizus]KAG0830256.1 hypothetical protein G6F19_007312 [Rhizopus arrhizus]KAG0831892.1 hypothetical protein G6F18_007455 [Rhizopus arrhizus]KAG0881840.1 hypothetical protein G6F15_007372 [Rhizopus arrhizus]
MKRKKKLTLDLSAQEGSSTKKLRINTSGSQVIQEKVPPQEEFDNNFQPPIKSTFNYVASSDPFEGFKKKSGKEKSPINNDNDVKDLYATALSTSATNHAISSSSKCPYHIKSKAETHQEFTKTSVTKAILNNICKDANMIMELQKWISHIAQVIYTDSMFTSYFYLEQVKSKQVPAAITHNLVYQLFLLLNRQGKNAGEEVKYCFDRFCEYLSERISLNEFKATSQATLKKELPPTFLGVDRANGCQELK